MSFEITAGAMPNHFGVKVPQFVPTLAFYSSPVQQDRQDRQNRQDHQHVNFRKVVLGCIHTKSSRPLPSSSTKATYDTCGTLLIIIIITLVSTLFCHLRHAAWDPSLRQIQHSGWPPGPNRTFEHFLKTFATSLATSLAAQSPLPGPSLRWLA